MHADVDLPWYWGFAARTLSGCSGLRSPLGTQLDAIRSGLHSAPTVDASRSEDAMHRNIGSAETGRTVAARLACLSTVQAQALHLHYDPHQTLPYAVDACAVLLASSRALVAPAVISNASLRQALQGASTARREAIAQQAADLVAAAKDAYELAAALVERGRGVQVDDPREWRRHG